MLIPITTTLFLIIYIINGELLINRYSREFSKELQQMISDRGNNNLKSTKIIERFANYIAILNENYPEDSYELPQKSTGTWEYTKFLTTSKNTNSLFQTFTKAINNRVTFDKLFNDINNNMYLRPKLDEEFISKYTKNIRSLIEDCKLLSSEQQTYHRFHLALIVIDLKQLILEQFRYLYVFDRSKQPEQISKINDHDDYRKRINKEIIPISGNSSNVYAQCPLKNYGKNDFLQIKHFLQGYVLNEMDLNSEGGCNNNCGHYKKGRSYACYEDNWCNGEKKCKGIIRDCRKSDTPFICSAHVSSYRRYMSISYAALKNCPGSQYNLIEEDCNYCFCICDESNKSLPNNLKIFNMRASLSDVYKNRIVTGVRFVDKNNMIHLQVEEGELVKGGLIKKDTIRWVPLENYTIYDDNIHENQDYTSLKYDRRNINLYEVTTEDDFVVTGVRFKNYKNHVSLEVKFCPFDYETGKLLNPYYKSFWKDNARQIWEEILINQSIIRTTSCETKITEPFYNGFIKFDLSSRKTDASQTIMPFINAQPLTLTYRTPLSGIGLFYRNQEGCSGFITTKLFTYNHNNKH